MAGLRELGHEAQLVGRSETDGLPGVGARILRRRGFSGGLSRLPFTLLALRQGNYDLTQAYSAEDAWGALRLGRLVVFSCVEQVSREVVADRRLRLHLLRTAVERSDAVVVPTEESAESLRRWLVIDPVVIDPADAASHQRLYRDLIGRSQRVDPTTRAGTPTATE